MASSVNTAQFCNGSKVIKQHLADVLKAGDYKFYKFVISNFKKKKKNVKTEILAENLKMSVLNKVPLIFQIKRCFLPEYSRYIGRDITNHKMHYKI